MPKVRGVYQVAKGAWYFKVRTTKDPTTGKWQQVTRRGFKTAAAASAARESLLNEAAEQATNGPPSRLTVAEIVEQYLDDAETADRLSPKTLFDYRHYLEDYVRPWIGERLVCELSAEDVVRWQRSLATEGGTKTGRGLPRTRFALLAPLSTARSSKRSQQASYRTTPSQLCRSRGPARRSLSTGRLNRLGISSQCKRVCLRPWLRGQGVVRQEQRRHSNHRRRSPLDQERRDTAKAASQRTAGDC